MNPQILNAAISLARMSLTCARNQTARRSMERSTVTGKGSRQKAVSSEQSASIAGVASESDTVGERTTLLTAHRSLLTAGFTLLELMIVISILIILVSVALPQYQKTT